LINRQVHATDRLHDAPDRGNQAVSRQTRFAVFLEFSTTTLGLSLLLCQTIISFSQLGTKLKSEGCDLTFKDVDNSLKRLNELIVVDVIDQLQIDLDDGLKPWSDEVNGDLMRQHFDQGDRCVNSHWQVRVLNVLIEQVDHVPKVFFVFKRKDTKLAINPAGTCTQEGRWALEFWQDEVLQELDCVFLVLWGLRHVGRQQAERMHQRFFRTEIVTCRLLHRFNYYVQVLRQMWTDLLLACLSDAADCFNHVLVLALHVPRVGVVNLQTHVFDRVLSECLHLILGDQQEWQCQLIKDRVDVGLTHLASFLALQSSRHKTQGRVEGL
jgi:hypothetical protein